MVGSGRGIFRSACPDAAFSQVRFAISHLLHADRLPQAPSRMTAAVLSTVHSSSHDLA
jgi:hypothetical protein